MKGLVPLFIGLFGTFAFSWVGLTVIPNWQIGALNPQTDEEGTDAYPTPKSGMADRGRQIYAANGCIYCHSQQIRPDYDSADIDRVRDAGPSPGPKWAERRSAPRDYIFDRPVVLGQERMGPDVANIGKAAPTEEEKPAAAPAANVAATSPAPATGAAGPAIDGIMVRGLYLYNPKQQEIVLDYFRNLANSPFFTIDPKTPERVIKSNSVPNDAEWAFPYELQLTLRKPVKLP